MTIRQVKQEPSLPPAHLYLEDIEEIFGAMVDHITRRESPVPEEVKTRFVIGKRECDTIDDLKKLGGRSRRFAINVGFYTFKVAASTVFCPAGQAFDTALRLMTARQVKLKTMLRNMGDWLGAGSYLGFFSFLGAFLSGHFVSKQVAVVGLAICACLILIGMWAHATHSTVYLRYSYETSPKAKIAKEWLSRGLWIVLGGLLGQGGQLLWHFLRTKIR